MTEILRITVASQPVDELLAQVMERIEQPAAMFDAIGAVLERNVQLRFETKTDPTGAPWAALAESTLKSYERKYKGAIPGSLLERTREMRNSLGYNVFLSSMELGFSVPYAQYAETGSKDGKHPPQRAMLLANWKTGALGPGDEADVVAEIESFLAQNL